MKAAVLHDLGRAPRCEEFAEPAAGPGEAIVRVLAASLKPIDRQLAAGSHFASPRELPVVCGADGVGELADGTRVFFGGPRRPYGAMAERTVVPQGFCFPVPRGMDDATAAVLPNPGSVGAAFAEQPREDGEGRDGADPGRDGSYGYDRCTNCKIAGGGAGDWGGTGNVEALGKLRGLGADATIQLDQPEEELKKAFAREAGEGGFNVVIDYVWGRPNRGASCGHHAHGICRCEFRNSLIASGRERWADHFVARGGAAERGAHDSWDCWNPGARGTCRCDAPGSRMGRCRDSED